MWRNCAVVILAVGFVARNAWPAPGAPEGNCTGLQSESESNDTAATADPISVAPAKFAAIYGTIGTPGDEDWFSFSSPIGAPARVWLSVNTGVAAQGSSRDSVVSIFGSDGVTLLEEDDDDGTGNGWDETIESLDASLIAGLVLPTVGTYYARVRAKVPGETIDAYSLIIAFKAPGDDPEVEPNPQSSPQQAMGTILGSLSGPNDEDWYIFGILDNGFPFLVVDGDPERDGVGTDVVLSFFDITTDSSGTGGPGNPPAEGFVRFAYDAAVRVTGPAAGTYVLFWAQSGECRMPAELQSVAIE